jgi:hypothetical protein
MWVALIVAAAAMSLGEVMAMRQQDILGRLGERATGEYPGRAGCRIHDRKYRCAGGETGIVAVTSQKLRKLGGSAVNTLRVDLVGVLGSLSGGFGPEHVRVVG